MELEEGKKEVQCPGTQARRVFQGGGGGAAATSEAEVGAEPVDLLIRRDQARTVSTWVGLEEVSGANWAKKP